MSIKIYNDKDWELAKFWLVGVIVLTILIMSLALMVHQARADEIAWESFSNNQIVEAIGKAENSKKYPYGVKSINTKGNKKYARKICFNSVRNGRRHWIKAGKPYDLIVFIGKRYCPLNIKGEYYLNKNWVRNVKFFLAKGGTR